MSEDDLLEQVRALCDDLGLLIFHARDSRRSMGSGFPDLVICGPRGVLFRELKTASGVPSHDQKVWGYRLAESGQSYSIWRPADLNPRRREPGEPGGPPHPGVIQAELLRIAGRRITG